jgi:NAD(P)-dependent dehydrogenase (short-subunit alcohol dehydrogenase family)
MPAAQAARDPIHMASKAGLPGPLAGRVVIVTGAARGLGRAYTLELCRQGAAVVATDVDEAALKEAADAVRDVPGRLHAQACDITDPDAPRLLLRTALRRYGQLHGLVSNAGLLRSGPVLRLDDDDLRLLLDVHVTAAPHHHQRWSPRCRIPAELLPMTWRLTRCPVPRAAGSPRTRPTTSATE